METPPAPEASAASAASQPPQDSPTAHEPSPTLTIEQPAITVEPPEKELLSEPKEPVALVAPATEEAPPAADSALGTDPQPPPLTIAPTLDNTADEINKAFILCSDLIDKPPDDYRLIKQAVLALQHLCSKRDDLRPIVVLKILQIIRDPTMYRSNPRRFAVQSLGYLTYYDESLIAPAIQLLTQLLTPSGESSQYVRKAAFMALSRIGRRYPQYQDTLAPFFLQHYRDPRTKISVLWGIIIGIGRLAQSNAKLRTEFAPEFVKHCSSKQFRLRWAGIKGLDVENDEVLEEKCYELATQLLKHGGNEECMKKAELDPEDWKRDDVYLGQYAATQALGLLLRSNPDKWWSRLAPTFGEILLNTKYAAMTKAMVMLTYGKIAYYMTPENPYYSAITDLLFELSKNENILVAEPATYGLCNFALAHQELYPRVFDLLKSKMHLDTTPLSQVDPNLLVYYLKPWCKLLSRNYNPILNLCSHVISVHSGQKISAATFQSAEFQLGYTDEGSKTEKVQGRPVPGNAPGDVSMALVRQISRDPNMLWALCGQFSTSVLESILMMLKDDSTLDDADFLRNLSTLIAQYNDKKIAKVDQNGLAAQFSQIRQLNPSLLESAVTILKWPEVLTNKMWVFNLKTMLQVVARAASPPGAQYAQHAATQPIHQGFQMPLIPQMQPISPVRQNPVALAYIPQRTAPLVAPASPPQPSIDPSILLLVSNVLQQPAGSQQLIQLSNTLPPAQASQIAAAVQHLAAAAEQQQRQQQQQLQHQIQQQLQLQQLQQAQQQQQQQAQLLAALAQQQLVASLNPSMGFAALLAPQQTQPQSAYLPPQQAHYYADRDSSRGRGGYRGGRGRGSSDSYHPAPYSRDRGR